MQKAVTLRHRKFLSVWCINKWTSRPLHVPTKSNFSRPIQFSHYQLGIASPDHCFSMTWMLGGLGDNENDYLPFALLIDFWAQLKRKKIKNTYRQIQAQKHRVSCKTILRLAQCIFRVFFVIDQHTIFQIKFWKSGIH